MILENNIHRYTDKDASLLSLKAKNKKQKKTTTTTTKKKTNKEKERSFHLFNILFLTITLFSCVFFNRQQQIVFDRRFCLKKMSFIG